MGPESSISEEYSQKGIRNDKWGYGHVKKIQKMTSPVLEPMQGECIFGEESSCWGALLAFVLRLGDPNKTLQELFSTHLFLGI